MGALEENFRMNEDLCALPSVFLYGPNYKSFGANRNRKLELTRGPDGKEASDTAPQLTGLTKELKHNTYNIHIHIYIYTYIHIYIYTNIS